MNWTKTYAGRYSAVSDDFRYVAIKCDMRPGWMLFVYDLSRDLRDAPVSEEHHDTLAMAKKVAEAYESNPEGSPHLSRMTRAIHAAYWPVPA